VIDKFNTSGFATSKDPFNLLYVAFYTLDDGKEETQNLAYSLDNGYHWVQYDKNPILKRKGS
jgi:beta-fructofuranosidase